MGSNPNSNIKDLKGPVSDNESDLNITAFDFRPPGQPVPVPCADHAVHDVYVVFPVLPKSQDNQDPLPGQDHVDPHAEGDDTDTIQELQKIVDATSSISCCPKERGQNFPLQRIKHN